MQNHDSSRSAFLRAVQNVVESDRCTGCGLCAHVSTDLSMELVDGFMRPVERAIDSSGSKGESPTATEFKGFCPGVRVRAGGEPGTVRDPLFGPIAGIWEAWATDPEIRFKGSSGGTLTAIAAWLSTTGQAHQVLGATADSVDRRRSVPVTITNRDEALASAGSRYAPCSVASQPAALDPDGAFIGKPCEASAIRARIEQTGQSAPLILSFFCAGTPSQNATDGLIAELGAVESERIDKFWYRGNGWPGRFTVETKDGQSFSTSYRSSWGKVLGPSVQWRCRTCADGVGESSDITAADFWRADESGYPSFDNQDGISVLIARTERGRNIITEAARAGVIALTPANIESLHPMQPYQVSRRKHLWGRLLGTLLGKRSVTVYSGFGLWRFAMASPVRTSREFLGTVRRLMRRRPRS